MINNLPEVVCNNCGWQGDISDLHPNEYGDDVCPDCGSTDIEDYEPDKEESESE